jgi:hypothetical protein
VQSCDYCDNYNCGYNYGCGDCAYTDYNCVEYNYAYTDYNYTCDYCDANPHYYKCANVYMRSVRSMAFNAI